jgi:hypothetical protein
MLVGIAAERRPLRPRWSAGHSTVSDHVTFDAALAALGGEDVVLLTTG